MLLPGLREIADQFSFFLIDIWGVLHNGSDVFYEAQDCLLELKRQGKTVVLCSNAPRFASNVEKQLAFSGLSSEAYDFIFTSGMDTYQALFNPQGPYVKLGLTFYHLGHPIEHNIWEGTPFYPVPFLQEASFILATAPKPGLRFPEDYTHLLEEAYTHKFPIICANPDRFVIIRGQTVWCAGSIGELYEKTGGKVFYHGKPMKSFFNKCLQKVGARTKNTLMIGDSMYTDIKGANNARIQSLLIASGIHKPECDEIHTSSVGDQICQIISQFSYAPTYVMQSLRW
jgi:HAD superfamily hydrolase (TIGR01459 family)